jgi:protocatechuate 3,4-dioxygenase beta subunit
VALDFGEDPREGGGRDITLGDHSVFDKADFKLPRGGVIAGRIVDEAGEPIEGVQVVALAPEYVAGIERLTPVASPAGSKRTNDLGRYRIFGLQPGEYYLAATTGSFNTNAPPNGDMASGYIVTFNPGTADISSAQAVSVSAAQETQADFAMVPSRTFDLSGIALDWSGRPLASATVLLTPGANASIALVARMDTAADGSFAFSGLAPGQYLLQAMPLRSAPPVRGAPPSISSFASVVVTVGANTPSIVLQGRPSRVATGEIVFEAAQPPFNPQAVQIIARRVDFTRSPMGGSGGWSRVNDDWTFELRDLWGPGVINVSAPSPFGVKAVRVGGIDVTDKPIDFDRDVGHLQIVLTGQLAELAGTVTDEGRPVPHAPVIVFASDPSRWDFESRFLRMVNTDENGHFTISTLPAAEYRAIALPRVKSGSGWQRPQFLEPLVRDSLRVVLHDGEHASVDLKLTMPR